MRTAKSLEKSVELIFPKQLPSCSKMSTLQKRGGFFVKLTLVYWLLDPLLARDFLTTKIFLK